LVAFAFIIVIKIDTMLSRSQPSTTIENKTLRRTQRVAIAVLKLIWNPVMESSKTRNIIAKLISELWAAVLA